MSTYPLVENTIELSPHCIQAIAQCRGISIRLVELLRPLCRDALEPYDKTTIYLKCMGKPLATSILAGLV